jgi:serine/threonine protein kinase
MTESLDSTRKTDNQQAALHSGGNFGTGRIVGGKYEILSMLGAGGMGTVYKVRQIFLERQLALKTLDVRTASANAIRRFQVEARTASLLKHPNLVEVHDFGVLEQDEPYLVMDFVDGVTLTDYLKQHGTLSVEHAVQIFVQVCLGLAYAHDQGVVHRDIKPGNIMLVSGVPPNSEGSVKIVDFGIAKLTGSESGQVQALTKTGEIFGSPLYMSPEQCSGETIDHRTDVYSLGCVLFESLAGAPPHIGQNALSTMMLHQQSKVVSLKEASLGKEFPIAIERIVANMLSKSPHERYRDLRVAARDLAEIDDITVTGERHRAKNIPAKSSRKLSISALQLGLLLTFTILFAFTIGAVAGYILKQSQLSSTIEPPMSAKQQAVAESEKSVKDVSIGQSFDGEDFKSRENEIKAAFNNAAPIKLIHVTENGIPRKRLNFPDFSLGTVGQYHNLDFEDRLAIAKGSVDLPNVPLFLAAGGQSLENSLSVTIPSLFSKIDPEAFQGLTINGKQFLAEREDSSKTDGIIKDILQSVGRWPDLKTIALQFFYTKHSTLSGLNQCKNLRQFQVMGCAFESPAFTDQPFVSRLTELNLTNVNKAAVDGIVSRLSKTNNLQTVYLVDCRITAAQMERLSSNGQFSVLSLEERLNEPIADDLLDSILKIKSLRGLLLRPTPSSTQLGKLRKAPWLASIELPAIKSNNELAQLKRIDSRIIHRD